MTIQRNSPCPCGSGIKFKKCCLAKQMKSEAESAWRRRIELERLMRSAKEDRYPDGTPTTDGMWSLSKLSRMAVAKIASSAFSGG